MALTAFQRTICCLIARQSAAGLSQWHAMLGEAHELVTTLPADSAGKCVLAETGDLYAGGVAELKAATGAGSLRFHAGRMRGALPQIVSVTSGSGF